MKNKRFVAFLLAVICMLSLCSSYDYILVPVSKKLNTHTFWARYGAVKVCDDGNNLHYILTKNKSLLSELGTIIFPCLSTTMIWT